MEHFRLSDDAGVVEVTCPERFVGRSIGDLDIRKRFGVHVVGIRRRDGRPEGGERTVVAPPPSERFEQGDTVVVLGVSERLAAFAKKISGDR